MFKSRFLGVLGLLYFLSVCYKSSRVLSKRIYGVVAIMQQDRLSLLQAFKYSLEKPTNGSMLLSSQVLLRLPTMSEYEEYTMETWLRSYMESSQRPSDSTDPTQ